MKQVNKNHLFTREHRTCVLWVSVHLFQNHPKNLKKSSRSWFATRSKLRLNWKKTTFFLKINITEKLLKLSPPSSRCFSLENNQTIQQTKKKSGEPFMTVKISLKVKNFEEKTEVPPKNRQNLETLHFLNYFTPIARKSPYFKNLFSKST